jgi:hypothetical protein
MTPEGTIDYLKEKRNAQNVTSSVTKRALRFAIYGL